MRKVTSKDGTTIAYDKTGSGPAVILFDGAFCSRNFGPMPKLVPSLAPHFTVYAHDRRARGDSGDTKPYAVEREIEDLEAMIREAGGSAFVFSISTGAILALRAATSGLNIKKLAIYEPPFMVGNPKHLPPSDHTEQLTKLIAADRRSYAIKYYMTKVIGMPALIPAIMQLLPMWSKMKANAPSLPYDSVVGGDFMLPSKQLASITIPMLVIGGDKSQEILRKSVQAVAHAIPGAQRRVLKGQTHNVSGKALAPALVEFHRAQRRWRVATAVILSRRPVCHVLSHGSQARTDVQQKVSRRGVPEEFGQSHDHSPRPFRSVETAKSDRLERTE